MLRNQHKRTPLLRSLAAAKLAVQTGTRKPNSLFLTLCVDQRGADKQLLAQADAAPAARLPKEKDDDAGRPQDRFPPHRPGSVPPLAALGALNWALLGPHLGQLQLCHRHPHKPRSPSVAYDVNTGAAPAISRRARRRRTLAAASARPPRYLKLRAPSLGDHAPPQS